VTIELTREQEQLIKQQLATGYVTDEGEVIGEALILLRRQGEARAKLPADIQEGLDDLAAERGRSLAAETAFTLADDIKQRSRALKAKREQTAH
jgi:Arc/MetJ-type ribon-helix-helix transcriptional regulator